MNLKRNGVLFYALTILNGLVPLITISFMSRILTSDQLGNYLLSFTIMNVLGMVVDFGISISGVRTLKKNNLNLTLDEFICSSFLLKFFVFFLVSICYLVFFTYTATEEEMFFIVTLLGVFITGMDSLWILQVSGDLYKILTKNIIANILYVMMVMLVAYITKDYLSTLILFVIYKLYILLLTINEVRKLYVLSRNNFSIINFISVFKSTAGIAMFRFFALSYTSANGILLNYLTNKYQVALYLAFEKLNKAILFIATPLTQALLPLFVGGKNNNKLIKYIISIIIISVFILVIGNLLSKEIVGLFIGTRYLNDDTSEFFFYMTIVSPLILLSNAIGMLYFIPCKLDRFLNCIICSAAFINIICVLYFVHSDVNGALQMARVVAFSELWVTLFMAVVAIIHGRKYGR